MESEWIVPPRQARGMWWLSWMSFFSGLVALWRGHWDLSLVPFSVWASSLLHWSQPVHGWRRTLDMTTVAVALTYQSLRAWRADHRVLYYALTLVGMAWYPVGVWVYPTDPVGSIMYHSMVHVFGNAGNLALYLGEVPAFSSETLFLA